MNIKNLLSYLLAFTVGFSFVACDECASENAGGAMGGAEGGAADCGGAAGGAMGGAMGGTMGGAMGGTMGGAMGGAGTMTQPIYNTIVILDSTNEINNKGTPGVDIAEVDFDCPDGIDRSGSADGELGSDVCDGDNDANCVCRVEVLDFCGATDRGDFRSAEDGDPETYVSLGIEGLVQFKFTGDVNGCEVSIFEVQGRNPEAYQVFACQDGALEADNPEELCVEVSQAAYPAGDAGTQEENTFVVNTMAN